MIIMIFINDMNNQRAFNHWVFNFEGAESFIRHE